MTETNIIPFPNCRKPTTLREINPDKCPECAFTEMGWYAIRGKTLIPVNIHHEMGWVLDPGRERAHLQDLEGCQIKPGSGS